VKTFDFEKYITVLQKAKGQTIPWSATEYPTYPTIILSLAQDYYQSAEYDRNFDRSLHQHHYYSGLPESEITEIIKNSDDYRLISAIMSAIIRGEKYTPGMWQALIENGIMLDLLVHAYRLKQN